ncbi:hypothetical protein ASG28_13180 [Frigoribacterium sp. Leaf415]|nr:hypothetical protein ASF07_13175 [Frigoribacterium sp. Leaf254]KQT40364.1 hypothetical protein ASG28_13180 [Frigoribacterium sp. Leaf415]
MDPTKFVAPSLRSGFITESLAAGHAYRAVKLQTDHLSSVALEAYERDDDCSHANPILYLGMQRSQPNQ